MGRHTCVSSACLSVPLPTWSIRTSWTLIFASPVSAVWTGSSTASYAPVGPQQDGRPQQPAGPPCELRVSWSFWLCCSSLHVFYLLGSQHLGSASFPPSVSNHPGWTSFLNLMLMLMLMLKSCSAVSQ